MRNSFCLTWPAKTLGKFAVCVCVCCCLCLCVVSACVGHFALLLCSAIALNLCFIASFPLFIRTHQKGRPSLPLPVAHCPAPSDFVCHCALCLMLCKLLPWLLFAIRFRQGMGCFVHFLALATLQLEFLSIQAFICHCFCRPALCFAAVVASAAALKAA